MINNCTISISHDSFHSVGAVPTISLYNLFFIQLIDVCLFYIWNFKLSWKWVCGILLPFFLYKFELVLILMYNLFLGFADLSLSFRYWISNFQLWQCKSLTHIFFICISMTLSSLYCEFQENTQAHTNIGNESKEQTWQQGQYKMVICL